MAEFSIHIRLDANEGEPGEGEEILEPIVDNFEDARYAENQVRTESAGDVIVPEQSSLEIDRLEAFAAVYETLQQDRRVERISLWGPSSERFPVPVQHYALQQIPEPDLFEYYAIDEQVTLVVADSEMAAEEIRREVPDAALGYSSSPF